MKLWPQEKDHVCSQCGLGVGSIQKSRTRPESILEVLFLKQDLDNPNSVPHQRGNSLYLAGALSESVIAFRMWGIAVIVSNWVLDKLPQT